MWIYAQETGALLRHGQLAGHGYSGFDSGKNDPAMQAVHEIGPIPRGTWTIIGPPFNSTEHGPYVLRLQAAADTCTFQRSGFLIHGDSIRSPGTASKGCIVLPRDVRELIWNSGDTDLEVVAKFAAQDLSQLESA